MRFTGAILLVWLGLTLAKPVLYSQTSQAKRADEVSSSQPKKPRDGLVDFTLKRINPTDRNYGECIDDSRRLLLAETIENGYFWSNALTLGLLLIFFLVILFQRGLLKRRALIYADILSQYQSALARAEAQGHDATDRNREFMGALRLATNPAVRNPSHEPVPPTAVAAGVSASSIAAAPENRRKGKASPATSAAPSAPVSHEQSGPASAAGGRQSQANALDQPQPVAPGLDLIAQNNALQQQLGLTQDQVKQLRRQVNESERQLQAEKQKNRSIKGE
jgi:hypothetical protein